MDVDTGELTALQAPTGGAPPWRVQCAGAVWAADSGGVYVVLRGPGVSPPEPGLYRAAATNGALVSAIPAQTAEGRFALVQSQTVGPDGALYALVAVVDRIPDTSTDPNADPPSASLYRVGQNGALELLHCRMRLIGGLAMWGGADDKEYFAFQPTRMIDLHIYRFAGGQICVSLTAGVQ